jgi:glycosyltransferase involved in cell wall biosynthesis
MSEKLTVIIPCKDEQLHIIECIESARLVADEIIVADSGSTDRSLELIRQQPGCRLIEREYRFSGDFKNWAIPQASNDWVLILDADERVSQELASSILQTLKSPSEKYLGYRISFDCYFLGRHLKHSGWNTDAIRFFRRECRYKDRLVHEDIDLDPEQVGQLQGNFVHYSIDSYEQYFQKYLRYTSWGAEILHKKGKRASFGSLFFRPIFRFAFLYFIRGGFLDGLPGLQVCMLTAFFNTFVKQAKLWELAQNEISIKEQRAVAFDLSNDEADGPVSIPFVDPAASRSDRTNRRKAV